MMAISVHELTKRYGDTTAVDALSFDVAPGTVTGFLGANGAGKTTTLRVILGLASPTAGTATVLGRPYRELDRPARVIGAALDAAAIHPKRRGRDHLRVLAAASGIADARVDEVLARVGLADAGARAAGGYSLGMRQRLQLAAALLGDPQVLVLDEPANGLDPSGIRWLRGVLREFADHGGAVLVSSHQLAEVAQIADEVVVIDRGRLVAHDTVEALTRDTAPTILVRTGKPERLSDALLAAGLAVSIESPDTLRVEGGAERVGAIAARARIPIFGLQTEARSLEDVFFNLTAKEELR